MKVELKKVFPMPTNADIAWSFLQNIEGVAGCMPGAKITERTDDTHYKGTVAVRVGPASLAFRGEIEVRELDAVNHVLHLIGKGSDTSGTSGAAMDLVARIEASEEPGKCNLIGTSEVTVSGKAAAFGGRMMDTVADKILQQFAANFAEQLLVLAAASEPDAENVPGHEINAPDKAAEKPKKSAELDVFALGWVIVCDWFKGLFAPKKS
jgi:carbon monoxide dehydrogenase subunit G